jgi:hypothetical protein
MRNTPKLMVTLNMDATNQSTQSSKIARREVLGLLSPAEVAIEGAAARVIQLGLNDARVRDAMSLLRQAKEHIADVIDDRLTSG